MAQQATDEPQLRRNQAQRAVDGVDVPGREAARLASDEVAAGMMAAGEVAKSRRVRRAVAKDESGRFMPVLALVLTVTVGAVLAAVAIVLLFR